LFVAEREKRSTIKPGKKSVELPYLVQITFLSFAMEAGERQKANEELCLPG
jgi:hypothetical protein